MESGSLGFAGWHGLRGQPAARRQAADLVDAVAKPPLVLPPTPSHATPVSAPASPASTASSASARSASSQEPTPVDVLTWSQTTVATYGPDAQVTLLGPTSTTWSTQISDTGSDGGSSLGAQGTDTLETRVLADGSTACVTSTTLSVAHPNATYADGKPVQYALEFSIVPQYEVREPTEVTTTTADGSSTTAAEPATIAMYGLGAVTNIWAEPEALSEPTLVEAQTTPDTLDISQATLGAQVDGTA